MLWGLGSWQPSSRIRCSSEIMQATCQEKLAVLSRESWLWSLCVIVIIPIDPIWYFGWGLPQNWSCLLWTMMNARRHLAPHTVHHPHDLYIDQHRSSSLPESKKSQWRDKRSWRKNTLKSNAKARVLDRNAACPESGAWPLQGGWKDEREGKPDAVLVWGNRDYDAKDPTQYYPYYYSYGYEYG